MVVDVALVGVVRDLLDDELPDIPNILGSRPRALGSIPPSRSLGSNVANILGSDSSFGSNPSSLGSIPANILGSMPMLFRMASFIDEAAEEEAGVEDDDDLVSRPNILGSIPMDFRTLGSIAANILGSSPMLARSLGSIAPVIAPAMAPDDFGSIPILANILGSIPARALGSNILESIDGSIPAA